ncbi:unnamed protein product [Didymodactylos carnosus]|uniref:Uncharacterized protein n=1 Tax=Didymodactylos carnosus TaxID=1234261 RepID=A0A814PN83_9BILA|nr:unnamed protein product [Didymodactylos carnosus]CAF3872761.1 unnamed protein product [Didymodactylos carnosus]
MDLKLLLTGSSAEGQSNCCQFAEYNIGPDIDIIIIFGTLDSEDELIKIKECPHYVRVKWNNTTLASLSHSDDKQYVNGFKMKQDHLLFIANHNQNDLYKRRMKSEISSQTAAIKVSAGGIRENFDSYAYSKNFKEALDKIEENRKNSKLMIMLKENYMIYYQYLTDTIKTQLPIFHEILFSDRPPLTCNDTDIHLTSPAFNIPLTMEHKQKARALIHFYKSHKKLSYPDLFSNIFEMINSIPNFDMDLVPALELKFWPKNVIPFLNRLKKNRCDLYEKISTTYMHLVAKESPTSLDNDKEYDFRYSFSVIEKILANERTKNEKILNGVAKNIYYKHLYKNTTSQQGKEQYIRSYLVKTTIFWMCEQQHDDINNVEGKNNDEIGKKLAYMWIQFTTKLLSNSLVKHYFIESVNLLDSYADDSRRTALHILQNDINLDDQTLISSTKNVCGELINLKCDQYIQYQYFLKTLRAIDIKQVRDDFVKLREQWFPKTVNDRNTNVLDILNNFALYDDGNGDEDTWTRWERLICNYDNLETLPLSYEISDCNPEQFVDSLSSSAFILNNMINIVSNIDYINEIKLFNGDDFKNTSQLYNNLKSIKQISQNHNTVDLLFKILIFIEPPIIQDCFLLDKRCLLDTHPDDPQAVSIKSLTLKKIIY